MAEYNKYFKLAKILNFIYFLIQLKTAIKTIQKDIY